MALNKESLHRQLLDKFLYFNDINLTNIQYENLLSYVLENATEDNTEKLDSLEEQIEELESSTQCLQVDVDELKSDVKELIKKVENVIDDKTILKDINNEVSYLLGNIRECSTTAYQLTYEFTNCYNNMD